MPILELILFKLKLASSRHMFMSYARTAGLLLPRTYTLTLLHSYNPVTWCVVHYHKNWHKFTDHGETRRSVSVNWVAYGACYTKKEATELGGIEGVESGFSQE